MAEPKEGESFFKKVVRFVANPATDWNEINTSKQDDGQDLERSELKAMVERKRRNDFVRKREFDTLRRLRRDGLSPEQLAALGGSSRVDDSEARVSEVSGMARADAGVKAKIDEIEQQMVGEGSNGGIPSRRPPPEPPRRERPALRSPDYLNAPTQPLGLETPGRGAARAADTERAAPLRPTAPAAAPARGVPHVPLQMASQVGVATLGNSNSNGNGHLHTAAASPATVDLGLPLLMPTPAQAPAGDRHTHTAARPTLQPLDMRYDTGHGAALEVSEVVHDPELDEAVIAFANADFSHCEQALEQQHRQGGPRHLHAETWLVLFDLYRATGQQVKFEALAMEFAGLFGRSAPQWFSLPKLVADAAAEDHPDTRGIKGEVGWVCPEVLDAESVSRLRSATLQLPLPWVLDWGALRRVEPEAADHLTTLLRQWAPQRLDMRWLAAELLISTLADAAPTGVRDADPAFWMARLEALRLANRPDQFDEAAIDYCVTYEVSPPSWERALCQVRAMSAGMATLPPPLSIVGEPTSGFVESHIDDSHVTLAQTSVELSGQLAGDIGSVLAQIDRKLGSATLVQVSCTRLIRVDFIAAGDLLNWVLAKQSENRSVTFADAHRLVALFFGAMGINEHARVQVSRN